MTAGAASIGDDTRVYVIGDIHGRADLLDRMIGAIERDLAASPATGALTVTLGDYVDRGPNSRGVIERLCRNPFPTRYIALKGNHEQLLLLFLINAAIGTEWRQIGGLETLHSYGVPVGSLMLGRSYEEASLALRQALPPEHLDFLSKLQLSFSFGRYFLCHAGVRPKIPLDRQEAEDLLWIRDEFLDSRRNFGKIVVHGHTPVEEPEVRSNRINIDTGAFITGRLTCLVIDRDATRFLTAS
jgi:serine/threonine protein phosphatase 1